MDSNKFTPKIKLGELLISTVKNKQSFVKQTQTKPRETFKMQQPLKTFFDDRLSLEKIWLLGLTS